MYNTKSAQIKRSVVYLHGWDAQAESWHGPIPLAPKRRGARTASKVRNSPGAFHGKLSCSVPGLPCIDFNTAVYYLRDAGLAIVHMDGSHGGPAGIVAVVPSERRKLVRDDIAFELMTMISFLGSAINAGCELQINDYIEEALRAEPSATQVFAVETAELSWDTSIVLSTHFENLAGAMVEWMATREPEDDAALEGEECEIRSIVPAGCPPAALTAAPFAGGLAAGQHGVG
jgi:hypothetical protein